MRCILPDPASFVSQILVTAGLTGLVYYDISTHQDQAYQEESRIFLNKNLCGLDLSFRLVLGGKHISSRREASVRSSFLKH